MTQAAGKTMVAFRSKIAKWAVSRGSESRTARMRTTVMLVQKAPLTPPPEQHRPRSGGAAENERPEEPGEDHQDRAVHRYQDRAVHRYEARPTRSGASEHTDAQQFPGEQGIGDRPVHTALGEDEHPSGTGFASRISGVIASSKRHDDAEV